MEIKVFRQPKLPRAGDCSWEFQVQFIWEDGSVERITHQIFDFDLHNIFLKCVGRGMVWQGGTSAEADDLDRNWEIVEAGIIENVRQSQAQMDHSDQ